MTSQDASFAKTVEQDRAGRPKIIARRPGRRRGRHFFLGSGGANQANFNIA